MDNSTRTQEEWRALFAEMGVPTGRFGVPPLPQVEVMPTGHYCINHTAIFYCPWCGASLPNPSIEEIDPDREGIHIAVDKEGKITWNGEAVTMEEVVWRFDVQRPKQAVLEPPKETEYRTVENILRIFQHYGVGIGITGNMLSKDAPAPPANSNEPCAE